MSIMPRPRAGLFVDGFNLYHAIDDLGRPYLKWLSLARLGARLTKPFQADLVEIVFCTAYFPGDFAKRKRHEAYVSALEAEGVKVVLGHTTREDSDCRQCGHQWKQPREKETDINVALSLFEAAASDRIDIAFLVTADTDQAATLRFMKRCFPTKQTVVLTPPGRGTPAHLQPPLATKSLRISETDLDLSVFPEMIKPTKGRLIVRPLEYRPPDGWIHPEQRR
jgi:hypothetical protein